MIVLVTCYAKRDDDSLRNMLRNSGDDDRPRNMLRDSGDDDDDDDV